ncbi:MAG: transcription termination/antitermination NusG family protein [Desulfomonile sp.]
MSLHTIVPSRYPYERPIEEDLGSWWVLHVKPNCEKLVATYLMHRDISFYLPLYNRKERVGYFQRIRTTEVPIFRGYLCFALEREQHNLLYDTKKLVRIIKVTDQERFVQELQSVDKALRSDQNLTLRPGLVPGARVMILSGPLQGAEGVVVRRRRETQLAVSVTMFNQSVLVKLDPLTKIELLS